MDFLLMTYVCALTVLESFKTQKKMSCFGIFIT
jgi:hypothetical protein